MQTFEYVIGEKEFENPHFLWRAVPAQIMIRGVGDTSGNWIFFVDPDRNDGVILTGTVTAEGENLTVTLPDMNTAELAGAIDEHAALACRATLTDGLNRVYDIPFTILNRAIEGAPTPAPQYYTKFQIDEIIAGLLPGGVASVNGETGVVKLDAGDVDAVSLDGLELEALTTPVIPAPGKVYSFAPAEAVEMTFPEPVEGRTNAFRLRITMPDPAVAVTWPAGLSWRFAVPELSAGTTSELAFSWTGSAWEGRTVPNMSEYALLSGGNTFSGAQTVNGDVYVMSTSTAARLYMGGGSSYYLTVTGDGQRVAFGYTAVASGNFGSLAVGYQANATGGYGCLSVGQGILNPTPSGTVIGKYNVSTTAALVIGGGTANNARANIAVIDWSGNMAIAGDLTFTPAGGSATTLSAIIARIEALEQAIQ